MTVGQKRTSSLCTRNVRFWPKADERVWRPDVRSGPLADIVSKQLHVRFRPEIDIRGLLLRRTPRTSGDTCRQIGATAPREDRTFAARPAFGCGIAGNRVKCPLLARRG
jgi:hypothetical protein